jgi:hypothetical protein
MFFEDTSLDRPVVRSIIVEEPTFRASGFDVKRKSIVAEKPLGFEPKPGQTTGLFAQNLSPSKIVVPPCPTFYERASSFLSDKLPLALINSILLLLAQQCIDFSLAPSRCKIDCVWYTETNATCTFIVRIFSSPNQKARHLVEFQRRSGCVMAFRKVFQRLLVSFSQSGVALGPAVAVLPTFPSMDVNLDKKTAALMLQTLCCEDVGLEYARETLRALSCLSKKSNNLAILLQVNPKLPELLVNILKSKDVETLRCAATFLANTLTEQSSHNVIRENISVLFDVYSASDLISPGFGTGARNLIQLELKRQITRCLAALSFKSTNAISKDPLFSSYIKLLKEATLSPDSKLQAFATQTLVNFSC